MSEKPKERPYKEIPRGSCDYRPDLSDAWHYVDRYATSLVATRVRPIDVPKGPGSFMLPWLVPDMVKNIEVVFRFKAGHKAKIQAAEEGAPVYEIFAPEGDVIIPVGKVRQWVLHLPAGTSVHAYIDKWQDDLEAMARQPKTVLTPEIREEARRLMEEAKQRRARGGEG
jgi:hypothetical protein